MKVRPLDGILTGIASAAIAGALWWVVATNVESEFWHLGAVVVGLIVGQGVLIGARKGGGLAGLIALVISAVAIATCVYFIDRSLTIQQLTDVGRTSDIPLWQGFGFLKDVYQHWWDYSPIRVGAWVLGGLIAFLMAARPGSRPIIT